MSDRRFAKSVIYLCAHSSRGAMGLIINQRAEHISFPQLLKHLDILPRRSRGIGIAREISRRKVHVGGPVETARGFVLHSDDYAADSSTLAIDRGICLTATVDIVRAIARGAGPSRSILALGYAEWRPGQLENEFRENVWLHSQADEELVFDPDISRKYDRALSCIGINPAFLSSQAGRA